MKPSFVFIGAFMSSRIEGTVSETILISRSRNHSVPRMIFNCMSAGLLAISLSACAVGGTMSKIDEDPEIITGSVTKPVEAEGIDPTDAETIKTIVVDAGSEGEASNLLAWSNPETGNSGTITAIDKYIGTHGQSCKKFRTTVDSFMGIALYNGETCELRKGFWVLSWFLRDDAG